MNGYPDDLSSEQIKKGYLMIQNRETDKIPQKKYLFGSQNKIVELENGIIQHKASTSTGNSGSPILRLNLNSKYEAIGIHTGGKKDKNFGVMITKEVITRIKKWIQAFWQRKQNQERIDLIDKASYQIVMPNPIQAQLYQRKFKITPDTTTVSWKQNKYRQDNANKNICIYQGQSYNSDWLCSSDLCDGECVFTIKVHKVRTDKWNGIQRSLIQVGVMDINKKGQKYKNTSNDCVYLQVPLQRIWTANQEGIDCSCQPFLYLPCLIDCHVNRNQNTITWHYNGKHQAKSNTPNSWKDQRKLCAIVHIWNQGDTVEFM